MARAQSSRTVQDSLKRDVLLRAAGREAILLPRLGSSVSLEEGQAVVSDGADLISHYRSDGPGVPESATLEIDF